VGFEATNYALVFGLDMRGEVGLKVLDPDILKVVGNDMAREIILKEKNLPSLCLKFSVLLLNPILIEVSGHPCFCVVSIIKPKLSTCLLVESPWPCSFANNERCKFLRTVGIRCQCISQPDFLALDPRLFTI